MSWCGGVERVSLADATHDAAHKMPLAWCGAPGAGPVVPRTQHTGCVPPGHIECKASHNSAQVRLVHVPICLPCFSQPSKHPDCVLLLRGTTSLTTSSLSTLPLKSCQTGISTTKSRIAARTCIDSRDVQGLGQPDRALRMPG